MATNHPWKILFLLQLTAQGFAPTQALLTQRPATSAFEVSYSADLRLPGEFNATQWYQYQHEPQLVTNSQLTPQYPPIFEQNAQQTDLQPKSSSVMDQVKNAAMWIGNRLVFIIVMPFFGAGAAFLKILAFGEFFGEFHELEQWTRLDFNHDTCKKPEKRSPFHHWPKSPEVVAQELGKPLPSGLLESSKTYGKYYSEVLVYHASMILSAIIFAPFFYINAGFELVLKVSDFIYAIFN